ncbi:MAG TPA: anthranilate synthase component I family protein [Acidimicrobiia bacterium]|nr:anthranilate synthase component I family protein [Acidimicrobiia bacterium]
MALSPADALLAVLAALPRDADLAVVRRERPGAAGVTRRQGEWVVGVAPDARVEATGGEALAWLDRLAGGWWAGWLAYDLGRAIERVERRLPSDLGLPDISLARFDTRLVVGPVGLRLEGDGPSRPLLVAAARRARAAGGPPDPPDSGLGLAPFVSSLDRAGFEAGVREIVDLIRAGQCYQVNLTRRLTSEAAVDPLALFGAIVRHHPAPHAALLRFGDRAVVSASPERFLRRRGDSVETRPIKGTARQRAVLERSAKDRAENVMITDLARNDLGRVCVPGSVAVPALCAAEAHPGLWHLVSTVTGQLRPGVGTGALVRATFPPASVTGAPKPRVLQAIEDLEPVTRGVYCGAVGWIDAGELHQPPPVPAALELNVAIRTFQILAGRTHLGVGGGITVDSDPAAEWRETELKAARLLAVAGAPERAGVGGRIGVPA